MSIIITFFIAHWTLSLFCQTFFLHRYSAHQMFTMKKGWEKFFYISTAVFQGSSFLSPRAYAILHREHHAYSDTPKDPHSPHVYTNVFTMMYATYKRYNGVFSREITPEPRFTGGFPEWEALDRFADSWMVRLGWMIAYTGVYVVFAPHWAFYFLLPVHYMMGPTQGAAVNWFGHKLGYRNFDTTESDKSRNTLPWDFLLFGELFQNNHHKFGASPDFGKRWFEIDPTYPVIRLLDAVNIIELTKEGRRHRKDYFKLMARDADESDVATAMVGLSNQPPAV